MVMFGFCFFVIFIFSCWFYVICKLLPFCLDSIFGNSSSLVVVPSVSPSFQTKNISPDLLAGFDPDGG